MSHPRRGRHDRADRPEPRLCLPPVAQGRARRGRPSGRSFAVRSPIRSSIPSSRARRGCRRTSSPARTPRTWPTYVAAVAGVDWTGTGNPDEGSGVEAASIRTRATARRIFAAAGCGGCHTLAADAGSNGAVGPNLDEAKPSKELVDGSRDERPGRDAVVRRIISAPSRSTRSPSSSAPSAGG